MAHLLHMALDTQSSLLRAPRSPKVAPVGHNLCCFLPTVLPRSYLPACADMIREAQRRVDRTSRRVDPTLVVRDGVELQKKVCIYRQMTDQTQADIYQRWNSSCKTWSNMPSTPSDSALPQHRIYIPLGIVCASRRHVVVPRTLDQGQLDSESRVGLRPSE